MVEILIKICGSIFIGGIGIVMIAVGLIVISVIAKEIHNKWTES